MAGRATTWQQRAVYNPHRPNPVDVIPEPLHELGEVFFPIPRRKKGHNYPHHMQEFRFDADDEHLNAYLEAGWGYGIACAGDLVVIDIDEKHLIDDIVSCLPETCWQWTGSGDGVHLFYFMQDMNKRVVLHEPVVHDCDDEEHDCRENLDGECEKITEWLHAGELKCDPHGYVVGPGSVHPSGNKYGPLNGDKIATLDKETLREAVSDYIKPNNGTTGAYNPEQYYQDRDENSLHYFYEITANEVMPALSPEERIAHPVHGSSTGMNFMKNADGKTFTCWRCTYGSGEGCGLNGTQYLACEATGMDCDTVRSRWSSDSVMHYKAWMLAVSKGLISYLDPPYTVIRGYGESEGVVQDERKLGVSLYYDLKNGLEHEMEIESRRRHG